MRNLFKKTFVTFLISTFLVGCASKENEARNRIKNYTNIEIPDNGEMVFHQKEDVFIHGIISSYTVFSFEEKPSEFLSVPPFEEGPNKNFEDEYNNAFNVYYKPNYTSRDVPEEYHVDWTNNYFYYKHVWEEVYFIYMENSQLLIVHVVGR
ncbi:MAG: hypothetical protein WC968_00830 [Bacilli bacterium]